jgi:putative ABC transport system permease protein
MKTLRAWIVRLCSLFKRKQQDREFAEEIESHLAMHIEDNLRSGMSPEEARRNAMIKFGGVDKIFEEHRDRRGFRWLSELQRNLCYAARILWKHKALSLIVIGILAFASAANTAVFSVYNFLFIRSFPYPHSERLVYVGTSGGYGGYDSESHYRYREENRSFEAFGSYNPDYRNYSRQGEARTTSILLVTYDFASVFQYQPALGRGFLEKEEGPGEPKVVMLSHSFWQREFGGKVSALGETLKLDGEVHTVVGVLPSNADFPQPADLWVLIQKGQGDTIRGYGRLKEGVSLEQAQQDLTRIHKSMMETRSMNEYLAPPRLQFLREKLFGNVGSTIRKLLIAAGILLLIVCLNIAGIMLARSESRSQEMGIRTALGASRAGIIRQLLTESLLLALPGVLLGLLMGQALLKLIALKLEAPSWVRLTPDIPFLAFCVVLTGATTAFFGLAPALQAARVNVQHSLHEASSRLSASGAKRRGLKMLVVGEVAFAVVLLVGAGLLLRSWQKMLAVDPGFRADHVFTFNIKLPPSTYKGIDDNACFFERFIESLRQLPGVTAASGANVLPLGGYNQFFFDVEGVAPHPAAEPDPAILMRWIFPDYFKTIGVTLVSGRDFNAEDGRAKNSCVAIVDQSFARRYWPGADPIGKHIRIRAEDNWQGQWRKDVGLDRWMTVVGLTRNVAHYGLDRAIEPGVYIPYNKWRSSQMYILVRSTVDPAGIVGPIRSQLHKLDPDVGIFFPMTMTEVVKRSTLVRRVLSIVMMLFAVAALLIAVAGVYGVVNYTVSRRTHEIGIRMALGATRGQILSMVAGGGARLMIVGAILGVAGAFAASQAMRNMLFGITALDVPTYFIVGAVLIGAVAAATLLPARRAANIEPMRALRSE